MLRFATEKFSVEDEDLANIFIHLTNFTVNKNGELNCDFPPGCQVEQDYMSPAGKAFLHLGSVPPKRRALIVD